MGRSKVEADTFCRLREIKVWNEGAIESCLPLISAFSFRNQNAVMPQVRECYADDSKR